VARSPNFSNRLRKRQWAAGRRIVKSEEDSAHGLISISLKEPDSMREQVLPTWEMPARNFLLHERFELAVEFNHVIAS
jgi:hypothetical protein